MYLHCSAIARIRQKWSGEVSQVQEHTGMYKAAAISFVTQYRITGRKQCNYLGVISQLVFSKVSRQTIKYLSYNMKEHLDRELTQRTEKSLTCIIAHLLSCMNALIAICYPGCHGLLMVTSFQLVFQFLSLECVLVLQRNSVERRIKFGNCQEWTSGYRIFSIGYL